MPTLRTALRGITCIVAGTTIPTAAAPAAPPVLIAVEEPAPGWRFALSELHLSRDGTAVAFSVQSVGGGEYRAGYKVLGAPSIVLPPASGFGYGFAAGITSTGTFTYGYWFVNGEFRAVRVHAASEGALVVDTPPTAEGHHVYWVGDVAGASDDMQQWTARVVVELPDSGSVAAYVRWNASGGHSTMLRDLRGLPADDVIAVGPDGTTAYGRSIDPALNNEAGPVRWMPGSANAERMQVLAGAFQALPEGCSTDGAYAVGATEVGTGPGPGGSGSGHAPNRWRATLWKPDGSAELLAGLPAQAHSYATAASHHAATVVGKWQTDDMDLASYFIWTRATGMLDLATVLAQSGADMAGVQFQGALHPSISADGTRVTAYGWKNNQWRMWVIDLGNDLDSDGIPNDWEANGIPYTDHEGVARRYPLPQANPLRKNLWVEVDMMQGQALPLNFFQPVVQAFADSPVTNPDGSTGITLHIQMDEDAVPPVSPMNTDDDYPFDTMDAIMTLRFGTPAERAAPDHNERLVARKLAFRYGLIADECTDGTLGFARDIYADDFIVFRGHFLEGDGGMCQACELEQWLRSTFMHELGHCLNLRHGGHEDVNLKPNYISTMNYLRQVPFQLNEELWRLDFSRGTMAPLNECCLNELTGFIDAKGFNIGTQTHWAGAPSFYVEGVVCHTLELPAVHIPVGGALVVAGGAPVDFNDDGKISVAPVAADLNYYGTGSLIVNSSVSPCQVLEDHDDWSALKYRTVALTALMGDGGVAAQSGVAGARGGDRSGDRSGLRCLTVSMVQELMQRMPAPAPQCTPADLNCDGLVNGADLGALLAAWGPCTRCTADLTGDDEVNGADLGALLAAWTTP